MGDPVTIGLAVASTAFSAVQQMGAAAAARQAGKDQEAENEYQAKQMEVQAGQERASSQRRAIEERRRTNIAESRAAAVVAGSGGDTLDPSVVKIMGDLESEGSYNVDVAKYEGEDKARNLETGASLQRYQGGIARAAGANEAKADYLKVGSTVFSGGSTLMDKYGGGGPTTIRWNDGTRSTYR